MEALSLLASTMVFVAWTPAVGDAVNDSQELSAYVWAGLKDSRARLERGIYVANGRLTRWPDSGKRSGDVILFGAFDFSKSLIRFDRTEPLFSDGPNLKGLGLPTTIGGKYARNEKTADVLFLNDDTVTSHSHDKAPPPVIGFFDVRSIGLYDWPSLSKSTTFENTIKYYISHPPSRVVSSQGVYHLTIEQRVPRVSMTMKLDLWVDSTRGFSPIRLERRAKYEIGVSDPWPEPDCTSDTTWDLQNNVWVPSTWRIDERDQDGKVRNEYSLAFEWKAINADIDNNLFSRNGFALQKGTLVVDRRLNKPIITEVIGGGPPLATLSPQDSDSQESVSTINWIRFAASIVSVSIILLTLVSLIIHRLFIRRVEKNP